MIQHILWQRTGGYWMFWTGFIYLCLGTYNVFVEQFFPNELLQVCWLAILALPFAIPPLGRWLNMSIEWDRNMFNWFGTKSAKEYLADAKDNVYNLPKPTAVPYVEPPKEPEKPVTTFYRLGITNNSRVSFQMGYSEITMNSEGIDNMIRQLQVFRDQVREYEESNEEQE